MLCVGVLLGIVVVCVAIIVTMLQRLETRNASFQPPMTALERQRLLPQDPVLDAAPRIEGLRYGNELQLRKAELSPSDDAHQAKAPLSTILNLQTDNIRAVAHQHVPTANQVQ